jgi:hypothetical protein
MSPHGPYTPGERVDLPPGGAVLVDKLGALAIETEPAGELAILLELGGRLNKLDERSMVAYLMAAGTVAELVANVIVAVQRLGPGKGDKFRDELEEAIKAEQARVLATDQEHRP